MLSQEPSFNDVSAPGLVRGSKMEKEGGQRKDFDGEIGSKKKKEKKNFEKVSAFMINDWRI